VHSGERDIIIPAEAGIQSLRHAILTSCMDPSFRQDDVVSGVLILDAT